MLLKNFTIEKFIQHHSLVAVTGNMDGSKYVYLIDTISTIENLKEDFLYSLVNSLSPTNKNATGKCKVEYRTILIYPATDDKIQKYFDKKFCITETYEEYKKTEHVTKIQWIENVFSGNETEKVFYQNKDVSIVGDSKWNENVDELYLLVLFRNERYASIRDIEKEDIALLKETKRRVYELVKEKWDLTPSDMCLYFHYRPTYYRLHIHAVNISKTTHCLHNCYRSILVDDVIKNISLESKYYKGDMNVID
ncbi:m7GpppX [Ecytonucleospora hepatopenaei]|uniref:M7GpppX n=1 Tax=Ecytonucleospora hepatopenaei TaxID=646526 RepID=A0A1W0E9B4_9MICR|nr:m7GpppX [Ecytonucleospora hepatopenaei]